MSSCVAKFENNLTLVCLVDFVKDARGGVSPKLIKQGLWIGGCLMEKFVPEDQVSISSVPVVYEDLDTALDAFELCLSKSTSLDSSPAGIDWSVLVPIILEIIRLITSK